MFRFENFYYPQFELYLNWGHLAIEIMIPFEYQKHRTFLHLKNNLRVVSSHQTILGPKYVRENNHNRLNSEKRRIFHFLSLNWHFWRKFTKMITTNSPYVWFSELLTKSEWPFSGKSWKTYIGRNRGNPGIHPSYHFYDFPSKLQLRLKMEFLEWLEIQPTLICC